MMCAVASSVVSVWMIAALLLMICFVVSESFFLFPSTRRGEGLVKGVERWGGGREGCMKVLGSWIDG